MRQKIPKHMFSRLALKRWLKILFLCRQAQRNYKIQEINFIRIKSQVPRSAIWAIALRFIICLKVIKLQSISPKVLSIVSEHISPLKMPIIENNIWKMDQQSHETSLVSKTYSGMPKPRKIKQLWNNK